MPEKNEKGGNNPPAKVEKLKTKTFKPGLYHFGLNAGVPFGRMTIGGHNWQRYTAVTWFDGSETQRSPRKGMILNLDAETVEAIDAELDRDIVRAAPGGVGERWDRSHRKFRPQPGDRALRSCVFFKPVTEAEFDNWNAPYEEAQERIGRLEGASMGPGAQEVAMAADLAMDVSAFPGRD